MSDNNLNLRSVKSRKIIGQIPPMLIRVGISSLFIVIFIFIVGAYYFRFDESIRASGIIYKNDNGYEVHINIAANQIEKIKSGQDVIIILDNIKNLYGERIKSEIQEFDKKILIKNNEGFCVIKIDLHENLKTENRKSIDFEEKTKIEAEIYINKINLYEKIINEIFN
ncbi:MAG: hypothetical protein GX140_06550 [Bacteroidales bacterium]|jgi:hypothetical protein|nr:hypothetical protein [Bacteroidales bacterium]